MLIFYYKILMGGKMPSYISHAIMGNDLFNISSKTNIFRIPITKEELRGYSLGADLAILSRKIKKDPHNYYTQSFFLSMIKYIKENKLNENAHIMSLLYGHIAHYFFDVNAHPLIFYIEQGCKKVGPIPSHHLIEGYLSSYLSEMVLKKDIMEISPEFFSGINMNEKEIIKLLDTIYGKIYNDSRITRIYKKTLMIFKSIESLIKNNAISKKVLISFTRFTEFMFRNNLNYNILTNDVNETYLNPVTGERHNESFMELYYKSIEMTLDAIIKVNSYLYGNMPLSSLESVFKDLSYDTGVSCSYGKKLIYVRK